MYVGSGVPQTKPLYYFWHLGRPNPPPNPTTIRAGMTECCGKIAMSILPWGWWSRAAGGPTPDPEAEQPGSSAAAETASAATAAQRPAGLVGPGTTSLELWGLVATSGRPFVLMQVHPYIPRLLRCAV